METSKIISTDKATVIQVNRQGTQNTVVGDDGQEARGIYHNTTLAEFFTAQPKALGVMHTVQIMIGVVIFLFGIIRTTVYSYQDISVISGITYWGSLVYISAGCLSVAAQNKLHLCVVKASLVMNVFSAMTAGAAIVLMSIEIHFHKRRCYYNYIAMCSVKIGILGIFLAFSILQFFISISGFACKATRNRDSTVVSVALNQGY